MLMKETLKETNRLKSNCSANSSIYALLIVHCLLLLFAMAMLLALLRTLLSQMSVLMQKEGFVSDTRLQACLEYCGKVMSHSIAGAFVGQSLGPVLGGVLSAFLGWRSIFWFLTIFAAAFLTPYVLFVPEMCRSIVGNGSISPPALNKTLLQVYRSLRNPDPAGSDVPSPTLSKQPIRFPVPLSTLKICLEKEADTLLVYAGVIFAGLATIATGLPSQFHKLYHFNDLQIGLSCIPMGVGSCLSAIVTGSMADWNYRRHAARLGLSVDNTRQQDL